MNTDKTNRQYRNADIERWRTMDFVLGYQINRSGNCDCNCEICKYGEGKYPKSFNWNGWHDGCKCHITSIMIDENEMAKVNQAFLKGQKYTPKGVRVSEIPSKLIDYVKGHPECMSSDWYQNNKNFFAL